MTLTTRDLVLQILGSNLGPGGASARAELAERRAAAQAPAPIPLPVPAPPPPPPPPIAAKLAEEREDAFYARAKSELADMSLKLAIMQYRDRIAGSRDGVE